jgi:hypothetical protein
MSVKAIASPFKSGLSELAGMVQTTEMEVISGANANPLVTDHINFFTKSFLISACAHLEMCVKEIVFNVALDIDSRLLSASIPSALIEWRYSVKKKSDSNGSGSSSVSIGMSRKDVDDLVSGNVYKTKDALALVGVDISVEKLKWESWKEIIQAIVNRRNRIVHHNDDASDISFGDVILHIASMIKYIDFITDACEDKNK